LSSYYYHYVDKNFYKHFKYGPTIQFQEYYI